MAVIFMKMDDTDVPVRDDDPTEVVSPVQVLDETTLIGDDYGIQEVDHWRAEPDPGFGPPNPLW